MPRESRRDDGPVAEVVLSVLDDEGCRAILLAADQPRSAQELAELTDIPQSTAYRKLDQLTEADLVAEETQIRADGKHTTLYRTDFDSIRVALRDFESFEVEIDRRKTGPEQQLVDLWAQVRNET